MNEFRFVNDCIDVFDFVWVLGNRVSLVGIVLFVFGDVYVVGVMGYGDLYLSVDDLKLCNCDLDMMFESECINRCKLSRARFAKLLNTSRGIYRKVMK